MKSGAIRGEQVFLVCHVYNESVMVTTIANLFKNYDYNAMSTDLSGVKTWAGPVGASLYFENTLCLTPTILHSFMTTIGRPFLKNNEQVKFEAI